MYSTVFWTYLWPPAKIPNMVISAFSGVHCGTRRKATIAHRLYAPGYTPVLGGGSCALRSALAQAAFAFASAAFPAAALAFALATLAVALALATLTGLHPRKRFWG